MHESSLPKILVADDDLEIQKMVKAALQAVGAEIIIADDGEQALEMLLVEKPNLVILDVMMPKLSGWEVAKYIREHSQLKSIKILMLTGIGQQVNEATSPLVGADDFLDKPFTFEDLADRVRVLLDVSA
ncbi:MAG: response regulator [Deltaproteobacteria bacterium]|nr:response regulator [Deltaproteobacteria bacterium]